MSIQEKTNDVVIAPDEGPKIKSETEIETGKKKDKKVKDEYEKLGAVVDILHHYRRLGMRRKTAFFKTRKMDLSERMYGENKKNPYIIGTRGIELPKTKELNKAQLEKATIDNLKEMYFKKPKIFKEMEEILKDDPEIVKREQLPDTEEINSYDQSNIFKTYLNKYMEKNVDDLFSLAKGKEQESLPKSETIDPKQEQIENEKVREEIKEQQILLTYKMETDDLFTNEELRTIKAMKECLYSLTTVNEKSESKQPSDVWEWNEFQNYFIHFPVNEDSSSISDSSDESEDLEPEEGPKQPREEQIKKYLIKWFTRESSPSENEQLSSSFTFHVSKYPKAYTFQTDVDRLEAALKFLRLALIVYPGFDESKVLSQIHEYTGFDTPYALLEEVKRTKPPMKKPSKDLRYFQKLIDDSPELHRLFTLPRKTEIRRSQVAAMELKQIRFERLEKEMSGLLASRNLTPLYEEFVAASVPSPYNILFVRTVKGLLRYCDKTIMDPNLQQYKKVIIDLVRKVLYLMLHTIIWIVDTLFRGHPPLDLTDDLDMEDDIPKEIDISEESSDVDEGERENMLKKLMVRIIKYMNVRTLLSKKHPDLSSSECQSFSCLGID